MFLQKLSVQDQSLLSCKRAFICGHFHQNSGTLMESKKLFTFIFSDADYMTITNENNQPYGEFCGLKSGKRVFVTGDYVAITFHSKSTDSYRRLGFVLVFTAVPLGK